MNRVPLLLLLLVCLGLSHGAPVEEGPQAASCTDPVVLGAANEALDKINKDRTEGYVFGLSSLANAHTQQHGENSIVFYLTLNVQETNCSVLSRRHFKNCEALDISQAPEYGQCKAAIFISRVNRVVRLYKYNCVVRQVSAEKVHSMCPDCPSHVDKNDGEIQKTVSKAVEKFNKESGLPKYFKLLQITRATSGYGMGIGMMYYAQFSIQETTCANGPQNPEACPLMDCEFAHKGFCKASHVHGHPDPSGEADDSVTVSCEIYEPQAAEEEKKLHLLGAAADHSHDDTQTTDHSHDHHHTHAGHGHAHAHSHGHDHAHGHHDNAHDHSHDRPHQHHQYEHAAGVSTHHHDHEHALDHAHNHSHIHEHEHHHHHHHHHQPPPHKPQGMWRQIPPRGSPVTLPVFPDVPAGPEAGVTLPLKEDPQIQGQMEPSIGAFPAKLSPECPPPDLVTLGETVASELAEDEAFKLPA